MGNLKIKELENKQYKIKEKARTFNGFDYKKWKENKQKDFDKLPIYFAFGEQQFKEVLKKLNLQDTKEDLQKLVSIGFGGIMRKCDFYLLENHNETFSNKILLFWLKNNYKFAYSAFRYELNNHEFFITYDIDDTLQALGLEWDDVQKNGILKLALARAKKDYWRRCLEIN